MNLPTQNEKFTCFEQFMFDHGYEHTVTESEFLNLNTYLYSYRDLVTLFGAALEDGPYKRAEDANLPPENLKLSPLIFEDLAEAAKRVAPTGAAQDVEVENINHFHNRQLPGDHNQMMNYYPNFSEPRPQPHGIAEWLIGLLVCGIIVFIVVLFYKMSM